MFQSENIFVINYYVSCRDLSFPLAATCKRVNKLGRKTRNTAFSKKNVYFNK
jgi:hypothetical protein